MPSPGERSGFGAFLRENWIYVVGPLLVILLGLLALLFFGDESPSNFIYNLFG